MKFTALRIALTAITAIVLCSGCAAPRYISYNIAAVPPHATVRTPNAAGPIAMPYCRRIADKELESGAIVLPRFVVEAPGHIAAAYCPETIEVNAEFLQRGIKAKGGLYHEFTNDIPIRLERDPQYPGPSVRNKAACVIRSIPPSVAAYAGDQFIGITPFTASWPIEEEHYISGTIRPGPVTFVLGGYGKETLQLPATAVNPDWRYEPGGRTFMYPPVTVTLTKQAVPEPDPKERATATSGDGENGKRDLDWYEKKYKEAIAAAVAECDAAIAEHEKQYDAGLSAFIKSTQDAGNLDLLLAAKKEKKRLNEQGLESGRPGRLAEPLQRLIAPYLTAYRNTINARERKLDTFARQYVVALRELEKTFTRENKIQEALEVRRKIETIERRASSGK